MAAAEKSEKSFDPEPPGLPTTASMASFTSDTASGLMMLVLCNGLAADDLVSVLESLRADSKKASSHKRRELYWEGYGAMVNCLSSVEGKAYCFLKYTVFEGEGTAEYVELTKRQKGLVTGGCDILARKNRPDSDEKKSVAGGGPWAASWGEDEAKSAYEDICTAEPVIYLSNDGVYVSTKHKRVQCKSYSSSPLKSLKDIEKAVSEIAPTLRSISFSGNDVPSILPYNVIVSDVSSAVAATLPSTIGFVNSTSTTEIYEGFIQRRSDHFLAEAEKMIASMLTDVAKSLVPLVCCASMKDAGIARKNSLMKKVYVHESKTKFIEGIKADGDVELHVISGEPDDSKVFYQYGGIVFELFYRTDLGVFG